MPNSTTNFSPNACVKTVVEVMGGRKDELPQNQEVCRGRFVETMVPRADFRAYESGLSRSWRLARTLRDHLFVELAGKAERTAVAKTSGMAGNQGESGMAGEFG